MDDTQQKEPLGGLIVLGYITAVLIPFVGFVLGIVAITRDRARIVKHGIVIVTISVVMFAGGTIAILNAVRNESQPSATLVNRELARESVAREQQTHEEIAASEHESAEEQRRVDAEVAAEARAAR